MQKLWICLITLFIFAPSPVWSETKRIVVAEDWQGFRFVLENLKTCYATAKPVVSEGKYTKRGDVLVFVSHFVDKDPNSSVFDQVSVEMGYPVKKGKSVVLRIGKSDYMLKSSPLAADRDTVYAAINDEKKLIAAFKKGYDFELRGVSSRGTKTYDKFSLKGFSKTYNAIQKECKKS